MSMGINIRMQEHNVDEVKHTVLELLGCNPKPDCSPSRQTCVAGVRLLLILLLFMGMR